MQLIKKITLISFLFFVFFIPFSMTWTNVFLYLSILCTLVDKDLYKTFNLKEIAKEEKWLIIVSTTYFVWCIISLFWSEDKDRGWNLIGRYIPIIIFPWLLSFMKSIGSFKKYKLYILSLLGSLIISSVVCLVMSYQNSWYETENGLVFETNTYYRELDWFESLSWGANQFAYTYLSHFLHPSYYSLYFLFAVLVIVNYLIKPQKKKKKIGVFILIYFGLFIYLLQSRSNQIATIIVICLMVAYETIVSKKWKNYLIGSLIVSAIISFIFIDGRLASITEAFIDILKINNKIERKEKINSLNARIIIWQNALQVIKQHPILGVGIGDTDTELENQYKKNGVDFTFGTHNQYIYAQLSMGIVGLLLLLAILLTPLYYGIKNRYFPLIGFSVAVMINLLFENMLTRNAGLMFIPWATMLLLMMSEEKKKEISNE